MVIGENPYCRYLGFFQASTGWRPAIELHHGFVWGKCFFFSASHPLVEGDIVCSGEVPRRSNVEEDRDLFCSKNKYIYIYIYSKEWILGSGQDYGWNISVSLPTHIFANSKGWRITWLQVYICQKSWMGVMEVWKLA